MRLVELRRQAGRLGVVVDDHHGGWLVTNEGTAKCLRQAAAATLDEVKQILAGLAQGVWPPREGDDGEPATTGSPAADESGSLLAPRGA